MEQKKSGPKYDEDLRKRADAIADSAKEGFSSDRSATEAANRLAHELKVHEIELDLQNQELRRIEEELEESRDRFKDLYDFAPLGYLTLDRKGMILETNLITSTMLGIDRRVLVGRSFSRLIAPSDYYSLNLHIDKIFKGSSPQTSEIRFIRADSSSFVGLLQSVAVRDFEGLVKECRSVISDISQQKVAEEKLCHELEVNIAVAEILEPLLSPSCTINDLAMAVFKKSKILTNSKHAYVNQTDPVTGDQICLTLSEMLPEECGTGGPIKIRFHVGAEGTYPSLWGHSLNTRESFFTNSPSDHPSAQGLPEGHLPLRNFLSVPVIQDDRLVGQIAVANSNRPYEAKDLEVIERLSKYYALGLMRKRFEQTQARFNSAIEQAAEGVVVTDTQGAVEYVNPAFLKITGLSMDEILRRKAPFFNHDNIDAQAIESIRSSLQEGSAWNASSRIVRKDGTFCDLKLSIAPVKDEFGRTANFVAVVRDVSDEVRLENQLLQSQKMEVVGKLAGGIAHDFNNMLQVVLGYAEQLMDEEGVSTRQMAELRAIRQAALSGADLVKRLMLFSRKADTNPEPLYINSLIEQVSRLLGRTVHKNIRIEMLLSDEHPAIMGDSTQIEQLIMNIVVNSRDAMPDGGIITIETASILIDDSFCSEHIDCSPGPYVLLRISDTGSGINEDVIPHIFEPFFTTKAAGAGTGFGLSIVYGIVKSHCGMIECESTPGAGTTFRIYFPMNQEPETSASSVETTTVTSGGKETILVVDDEENVRRFQQLVLNQAGYTALTAVDGVEALDIYQSRFDSISLIILDLVMPRMDGVKCLRLLKEINPRVKVILCSGLIGDSTAEEFIKAGAMALIEKPAQNDAFLRKVREVLDQ